METILKELLEIVNNPWEGVQESFQLKWLRKLSSMSELKNFTFKMSQSQIRIGFYRPVKLGFGARMLQQSLEFFF